MAKGGGTGGDRHQQCCVAGMVLMRFFLGVYFVYDAMNRLMATKMAHGFIGQLTNATGQHGNFIKWSEPAGFTTFLAQTVHHQPEIFAWLIMLGSALAGVLFLFGFLTRLASLIAIPISMFFLLATFSAPAPYFGFNAAFLVAELAVGIAAAGRTWGIDALLARNTKLKILW